MSVGWLVAPQLWSNLADKGLDIVGGEWRGGGYSCSLHIGRRGVGGKRDLERAVDQKKWNYRLKVSRKCFQKEIVFSFFESKHLFL